MPGIGLFGKLPAAGDFVGRGFSLQLRDALDGMLQSALRAAQSEGATRQSLESSARGLVLNVRPGVLCKTGFLGCVAPSCDRVGRFFPLCVGLETEPMATAPAGASPLPWISLPLASALCRIVYEAQTAKSSADALMARLPVPQRWAELQAAEPPFADAVAVAPPANAPIVSQFTFEGPERDMDPLDLATCSQLPMVAEALGAVITEATHFDLYFATRSLLAWSSLAALFDGRWEHWGWTLRRRRPPCDEDEDEGPTLAPFCEPDGDDAPA